MSEEINQENNCFCKSKGFRKFLTIALGTFVGVYGALCLFTALHRPPIAPPFAFGYGSNAPIAAPCPFKRNHHFYKEHRGGDFHKVIKEQPFNKERAEED